MVMRRTFVVLGALWIAAAQAVAQGPIRPKPRPPQTSQGSRPAVPSLGRRPIESERVPTDYASPSDPLLVKAIAANKALDEKLPNFLCQQIMLRSRSRNLGKKWKDDDVVEAEVLIADGKEQYRDIRVDGQPTGAKDLSRIGGAWSMGEYSTVVWNLYLPRSRTQFSREGPDMIADRAAVIYRYKIEQENSRWLLHVNGQKYTPGHHGKVWIDLQNGRTLRVTMEATFLPSDYPLSTAEGVLEYADIEIDGQAYLLPAFAENTACGRGSAECARTNIEFRDYQKFSSESSMFTTDSDIEFGEPVPGDNNGPSGPE